MDAAGTITRAHGAGSSNLDYDAVCGFSRNYYARAPSFAQNTTRMIMMRRFAFLSTGVVAYSWGSMLEKGGVQGQTR